MQQCTICCSEYNVNTHLLTEILSIQQQQAFFSYYLYVVPFCFKERYKMKSWYISEEIYFHCVLCWLTVSGSYLFTQLYCFFQTRPPSSIHFAADSGLLVGIHLTNRDNLQINISLQCLHRHIFANFRLCRGYSLSRQDSTCASLTSKTSKKKGSGSKVPIMAGHTVRCMSHICNRVETGTERGFI